jgi:hypothetical protein
MEINRTKIWIGEIIVLFKTLAAHNLLFCKCITRLHDSGWKYFIGRFFVPILCVL